MKRPPALKAKTERSPPRLSPSPQTSPTPHYPSPRTTTHSAYERSVCFASCKTPGVQYRASLPVPCQRDGQGSLVSNTTIIRDTRNTQISQTLSAVKTEGSPASNLSASAITSANNPSVTAPKNSVLYQYIFNLILTAIPKMLYRTVTAPFTQGSQV